MDHDYRHHDFTAESITMAKHTCTDQDQQEHPIDKEMDIQFWHYHLLLRKRSNLKAQLGVTKHLIILNKLKCQKNG